MIWSIARFLYDSCASYSKIPSVSDEHCTNYADRASVFDQRRQLYSVLLKMRDMKMRDQIAGVETTGKVSMESQSVKKCLKVVVFVCRVIPSV